MACYPGLGWLEGTFAPHYEETDEDWRKQLFKSVKAGAPQGLGCDNNVGIHYINEQRYALSSPTGPEHTLMMFLLKTAK